ncbi:MAG: hypothetical protein PHP00_09645 [Thiotrichaceae bacterium]|nr:hypothetical protein [Thiotrichaceae bacterium]
MEKLLTKIGSLRVTHKFKINDRVQWKKGLRNKKRPLEEQTAIVMEVLKKPLLDHEKETGSPYFREPLDLALAMLDEDDDLVVFYYDSRRFEPVPGE